MTKNAQITGLNNKINRYQSTIDQLSNVFGMGYVLLGIFMIGVGAFPIAIILGIFAIWLEWEYLKIYRLAFPKTN